MNSLGVLGVKTSVGAVKTVPATGDQGCAAADRGVVEAVDKEEKAREQTPVVQEKTKKTRWHEYFVEVGEAADDVKDKVRVPLMNCRRADAYRDFMLLLQRAVAEVRADKSRSMRVVLYEGAVHLGRRSILTAVAATVSKDTLESRPYGFELELHMGIKPSDVYRAAVPNRSTEFDGCDGVPCMLDAPGIHECSLMLNGTVVRRLSASYTGLKFAFAKFVYSTLADGAKCRQIVTLATEKQVLAVVYIDNGEVRLASGAWLEDRELAATLKDRRSLMSDEFAWNLAGGDKHAGVGTLVVPQTETKAKEVEKTENKEEAKAAVSKTDATVKYAGSSNGMETVLGQVMAEAGRLLDSAVGKQQPSRVVSRYTGADRIKMMIDDWLEELQYSESGEDDDTYRRLAAGFIALLAMKK